MEGVKTTRWVKMFSRERKWEESAKIEGVASTKIKQKSNSSVGVLNCALNLALCVLFLTSATIGTHWLGSWPRNPSSSKVFASVWWLFVLIAFPRWWWSIIIVSREDLWIRFDDGNFSLFSLGVRIKYVVVILTNQAREVEKLPLPLSVVTTRRAFSLALWVLNLFLISAYQRVVEICENISRQFWRDFLKGETRHLS